VPTPSIPDAIPAAQRADLAAVLVDLPEHRRLALLLRIERWWDDLRAGVAVYANADEVAGRATLVAARAFAARDDDLHLLDERRTLQPDWELPIGSGIYAGWA
jgi:amylosucrase